MASKAEQIVGHFTQDETVKADVLGVIEEIKANPGQHNVDTIIDRFTSDPDLKAKIKEIIGKVNAGHPLHAITAYHHADQAKAHRASEKIAGHRGAVEHILGS
jgi:hypothetical protein